MAYTGYMASNRWFDGPPYDCILNAIIWKCKLHDVIYVDTHIFSCIKVLALINTVLPSLIL